MFSFAPQYVATPGTRFADMIDCSSQEEFLDHYKDKCFRAAFMDPVKVGERVCCLSISIIILDDCS